MLKDSMARKQEAGAMQETYRNLRAQLVEMGVLAEQIDGYRFTQDYPFAAISAAAQVVSGQNVSGRTAWKLEDSRTFADWQEPQLRGGA